MARLATASASGQPDVAAVTFGLDGDSIVSGGFDITKTVRLGNLKNNPRGRTAQRHHELIHRRAPVTTR